MVALSALRIRLPRPLHDRGELENVLEITVTMAGHELTTDQKDFSKRSAIWWKITKGSPRTPPPLRALYRATTPRPRSKVVLHFVHTALQAAAAQQFSPAGRRALERLQANPRQGFTENVKVVLLRRVDPGRRTIEGNSG